MNRITTILTLLLCIVLISSCNAKQSNKDGLTDFTEQIVEDSTSSEKEEKVSTPITKSDNISTITGEATPVTGGFDQLEEKYVLPVNNIYCASLITGQEKRDDWVDNVYKKQSREERRKIPALYQMIRYFNIEKSDLIKVYTDWYGKDLETEMPSVFIDALYEDDEKIMKQKLVSPYALYYDGEIYTWYDILSASNNTNEMMQKEVLNIPNDVLTAYLNNMQTTLKNSGLIMPEDCERISSFIKNKASE